MENIERLSKLRVPLVLKTVGLKQNKGEILNVKSLAARKLGRYKFKFDSFIFPRINGDKAPCRWRLSPEEILAIENSDPDMLRQREDEFCGFSSSKRGVKSLYRCASWKTDFFINPYGRLQFCHLTDKFSVDLKKNSFNEGFYNEFPKLLKREFITGSRCQICSLRRICYHCPARAFLETKDEEAPVGYFCAMAKARHNAIGSYGNKRPRL
jgi:radical SAM protein with 4Fe4S-binding SPASM domain